MQQRIAFPTTLSAILLAGCLLFTPQTSIRVGAIVSVGDVLFLAAVMMGLLERLLTRDTFPILPVYLLAALLLTVSYMANFDIRHPDHNKYFFIALINFVLVPSGLLMVRIRSTAELNGVLYFWLAGATFGAVYAYAYTKGFIPWHHERGWQLLRRLQGLTPHPNVLSINIAIAAPIALLLLANHRNLALKILAMGILVLLFLTMDKTGSRGGLGTMLAGCLAFLGLIFLLAPAEQKLRLTVLFGIAGMGLIMLMFFMDVEFSPRSALSRLTQTGDLTADMVRDEAGRQGIQGFLAAPIFGEGFQFSRHAHNFYIQALHSAGVVGLFGYVLIIFYPLYLLLTTPASTGERNLQLAMAALTMALLAATWFKASFTDLNVSIAFALALYTAYLLRTQHSQPHSAGAQKSSEHLETA